ncbi:MAG TPA: phospholipid carrier-dependent glycosyltransferase [Gemmatimonadaceae bacterium]|nr:phospholipid carrier-dependent glycosyltransferase [Gemmatimonadaceae bacterium]
MDQSQAPVRRWLLIALVAVLFAASVEVLPVLGARLRVVLALTAVWFSASAWIGRRTLVEPVYRPAVLPLMAVSYALLAIAAIAAGENPLSTDRLAGYCALSVGWATLFLLVAKAPPVTATDLPEPTARHVVMVVVLAAGIASVAHGLATPRWPLISDEAVYVLQSEWYFKPNYSWQVPREIADFFVMRKFGYHADAQHFYGMYPPGWPFVLAVFDRVGLRWWTPILMAAGSVALTFYVGSRAHSRKAGIIAATLLAIQQWFVIDHGGYMSDGFATFTTVAGAASLLAAEAADRPAPRVLWGVVAGVALGMGVAARPLSGIVLGITVVLWIVLRRRMPLHALSATAAGVLLGGMLPAALLLHYNMATNGEPLRLAYQAIHGHGYDLGFGTRGFLAYNANLERVHVPIVYTPREAVAHLFSRFADFAYAGFGIALLLPLVAVARAHRIPLRWRLIAPFFLMPFVYFFYWYSGVRYYTSLLPFLLIGCAVLVLDLWRRDARLALGMLACAVVGSFYFALPRRTSPGGLDSPWTRSAYFRDPGRMGTLDSLAALGARVGPLLVFARQQDNPFDNLLDRLQLLNADGLDSRVLVARDLGARNRELRARYPGRKVYIVEDRGRDSVSRIVPLDSTTAR